MFKEAKEILDKSNKIYIVGHKNPDGDSIGSSFALYFALKKLNKDVKVVMPKYSDSFSFLPGIDTAVSSVIEDSYDLLIAVDSSSNDRLALSIEDFEKAKRIIMLDHHQESNPYGDFRYIDSTKPAASEIIYDFIQYLNIEIDKNIATYIYTGIMTDTGSFNYESTKPSTLYIASKLLETGIDFAYICKKLNDTIKEAKLKLIAKTIDNMEVMFDGKFRYSFVDYNTINGLGLDEEDAEGMTNYLRKVENTEIAAYVRERKDKTAKVSLRSGGDIDVSEIAIKFGGGGHKRAAGYTMLGNIDEEKQKLIDVVEVMLK